MARPTTTSAAGSLVLSVCFFCKRAYPLFEPNSPTIFGGAEVRSSLFARELARRSEFRISFLVADEGQPAEQTIDGLRVVADPTHNFAAERFFESAYHGYLSAFRGDKLPSLSACFGLVWQLPVLAFHRFFYRPWATHRKTSKRTLQFLASNNIDVLCWFHVNEIPADMVAACRRLGIKLVIFLLHDDEVSGRATANVAPPTPHSRDAIARAHLIVAQTELQAELVKKNFGRDAVVIRNPVDLDAGLEPRRDGRRDGRGEFALWIGRAQTAAHTHKRPELLFELARRCPEIPFVAVMNADNPVRFRELVAIKPDNLRIVERLQSHGHAPRAVASPCENDAPSQAMPRHAERARDFDDIDDAYRRSHLFISTSGVEGFPNTFLQAAKHSTPIVSLAVDPEGMLSTHHAGVVCGDDLDRMTREVKRLWADPNAAADLGRNGRIYVERRHDIKYAGDSLAQALERLLPGPGSAVSLSVALCTFNGERFLSEQLESYLTQTRRPDELVVCDDASTDATPRILADFAARAPFPVRIEINPTNLGSTRNFDRVISMCKGKIIALSDQDDVWMPDKLARLEAALVADPSLAYAFSDAEIVDDALNPMGHTLWRAVEFTPSEQERFPHDGFRLMLRRYRVTGATMAFRASYLPRIAPIPAEWMHDAWIALMMSAIAPGQPIAKPLIRYRQHPRQQVGERKRSLYQQYLIAKSMTRETYQRVADTYIQARDRLAGFGAPAAFLAQLDAKIEHFTTRAAMRNPGHWRLPRILSQTFVGHYGRYSNGWKSIAQDLFLK